jgi:hypothetical protein
MFGFGSKRINDPKEAIDMADKVVNKGLMGFIVRIFMGKDFVNRTNQSLNMAKQYTDYSGKNAQIMVGGLDGSAEVLSIADTGAMVNFNPVVKMKLKVQTQYGGAFVTEIESAVSKIAVPRTGDILKIKYNPANSSELVIV